MRIKQRLGGVQQARLHPETVLPWGKLSSPSRPPVGSQRGDLTEREPSTESAILKDVPTLSRCPVKADWGDPLLAAHRARQSGIITNQIIGSGLSGTQAPAWRARFD